MNQSKIRNPIVTYTLTLMIWSGVSQIMVVGVVCSHHGNTLDASRGCLFPSYNCEDDDNHISRGRGRRGGLIASFLGHVKGEKL